MHYTVFTLADGKDHMIKLPVSVGEAVDKLTILDIKTKRIVNNADSKKEHDLLHDMLRETVEAYPYHYKLLRSVNESIWVLQDEIRAMDKPSGDKCIDILNKNDMRFRIKDALNRLANSALREQKGYPPRCALFIGHLGLGDMIGLNGAVRYVALHHDETHLVCKESNAAAVAAMYADVPSIRLLMVTHGGYTVPPSDTTRGEAVAFDPALYTTVYRSGFYAYPRAAMDDLPSCFYRDMGMDPSIRHTFFHVPPTAASKTLMSILGDRPYIFTQQKSSGDLVSLVTWDKHALLTIDPNVNVYSPGDAFYEIAEQFINKPFFDYVDTLVNASEVHTVDSSFYCLASYLPLKASSKTCHNRVTGALIASYDFK